MACDSHAMRAPTVTSFQFNTIQSYLICDTFKSPLQNYCRTNLELELVQMDNLG